MLSLGFHVIKALLTVSLVYPFLTAQKRDGVLSRWSRDLLAHLGVEVCIHGSSVPSTAKGAIFLVANHISWLDIFAINSVLPTCFIAKSEIRDWPILGWLCEKAGTVFIRRQKMRDLSRLDVMLKQRFIDQVTVGAFLEGTTTDGRTVLPFKSGLLRAALQTGTPILPVALQYCHEDGSFCDQAAFVGEKTLASSLKEILGIRKIFVHVHLLPMMDGVQRTRQELALAIREAILQKI